MLLASVLLLSLFLPRALSSWLVSFLMVEVSSELFLESSQIVLIWLLMVSFFAVAAISRVSKDSPSFSAIS